MLDKNIQKFNEKTAVAIAALLSSINSHERKTIADNALAKVANTTVRLPYSPLLLPIAPNDSLSTAATKMNGCGLISIASVIADDKASVDAMKHIASALANQLPLTGDPDQVGVDQTVLNNAIPITEAATQMIIDNPETVHTPTNSSRAYVESYLKDHYSCASHTGYLGGSIRNLKNRKIRHTSLSGDAESAMTPTDCLKAALTEQQVSDKLFQLALKHTTPLWITWIESQKDEDLDAAIELTLAIIGAQDEANVSIDAKISSICDEIDQRIASQEQAASTLTSLQGEAAKAKWLKAVLSASSSVLSAMAEVAPNLSTPKLAAASFAAMIVALKQEGILNETSLWGQLLKTVPNIAQSAVDIVKGIGGNYETNEL